MNDRDAMVEVWTGDQFIDVMTYGEYLELCEAGISCHYYFCPGYGP